MSYAAFGNGSKPWKPAAKCELILAQALSFAVE
jgi:hypothetical protein